MGTPDADAPSLQGLRHRVRRLEDLSAVHDLLSAYAFALDNHGAVPSLCAAWVDCFTHDAVWDVRGGPRNGRYVGHDALWTFIRGHHNDPPVYQHYVACPRVALDGDRGTVASYLVRVEDNPGTGPRLDAFGTYDDVVVREHDGRWRFRRRTVEVRAGATGSPR